MASAATRLADAMVKVAMFDKISHILATLNLKSHIIGIYVLSDIYVILYSKLR
jgi:hypothetical protein